MLTRRECVRFCFGQIESESPVEYTPGRSVLVAKEKRHA